MKIPKYLEAKCRTSESSLEVGDKVTWVDGSYHLVVSNDGFKQELVACRTGGYEPWEGTLMAVDCVLPATQPSTGFSSVINDVVVLADNGKVVFTQVEYLKRI